MILHPFDYVVIILFITGTLAYGLWSSRSNDSTRSYFLADRSLPWWAVMFSIVATETSVLTFISVPGIAYRGEWFFLQLAFGYIIGRVAVSFWLLPLYYAKGITSIYQYIGSRFGEPVQRTSSAIFLVTRILADGVRFFATALMLATLMPISMTQAVLLIGGVTVIYTLAGGIRAVVWMDTFQFGLYLGAAAISLYFLNSFIDGGLSAGFATLADAGKLRLINLEPSQVFSWNSAYSLPAAVLGGAFLSFASHGTDYMMVQRVLSTRSLSDAKKALVGSGIFVLVQFGLFLLVGGFIWVLFSGQVMEVDTEFPMFIGTYLPAGVRGLLLAGVLAAAMSTLSSSINSLASSTVNDWLGGRDDMTLSRLVSFGWGAVLIVVALMFQSRENPVVELGLQIASYTYGGLLGLFLLGRTKIVFHTAALIAGLLSAAGVVLLLKSNGIAWTWYIVAATAMNMAVAVGFNAFLTKQNGAKA